MYGNLPHTIGEGHAEPSGGGCVSVENCGQRIAAFGPGQPGFQDGLCLLVYFTDVQRAAVKQHNTDIGIYFADFMEQFQLAGR